jgi:hypothetical protein
MKANYAGARPGACGKVAVDAAVGSWILESANRQLTGGKYFACAKQSFWM